MILCTNPKCQTTAGCVCQRSFMPGSFPAPEKATPIPAEVLAKQYAAKACVGAWTVEEAVLNAIRADREARPSLPDSREEREDVLDRLYAKAREDRDSVWPDPRAWDACEWLSEEGAMLPADRARARQGGNNG